MLARVSASKWLPSGAMIIVAPPADRLEIQAQYMANRRISVADFEVDAF